MVSCLGVLYNTNIAFTIFHRGFTNNAFTEAKLVDKAYT